MAASRASATRTTSASSAVTRAAIWSRAPSRRAWSSSAGVVLSHPWVTACSTTAGLKAANAAHTTRHGAAPSGALREQKYPSK